MDEPGHSVLHFCGYRLDPADGRLQSGPDTIALRPKTFALLAYLAERPGRLVTKNELLRAIWPDTVVGEEVLTTSIKELRRILGDDARQPHVIQTEHRRGYRFIAAVHVAGAGDRDPANASPKTVSPVGRGAELAVLDGWLQQALARKRQVGFVVGGAGIGKTTLIEEFLKRLTAGGATHTQTPGSRRSALLLAYGQCLEQYSTSEPYLPVIEAFRQLCSTPDGAPLESLLRDLAPSWIGLLGLSPGAGRAVPSDAASPERMRREMAAVIDALPVPLVLVLEDLHWSDLATVDLLARLAQGRAPTSLLLIGTYRAAEMTVLDHPLKGMHQELLARGQCRDLWLDPLDPDGVIDYVRQRCPGLAPAASLGGVVHARTDGNALFVVNVVNELVATGVLAESGGQWTLAVPVAEIAVGIPDGLRQLLVTRLERHSEQQRAVIEAGSVAGRTFSAAEVAAALELPLVEVEAQLESLARRAQLLRAAGADLWADGTHASRYALMHALYEDVLYDRIPAARRSAWHGRIAERLERGYAGQTADIAIHLARHFEAGGMAERAVAYLEEAAERASRYGAERETVTVLERALAILERLPRSPERVLRAIRIYLRLGQALLRARGLADPDADRAFASAWALAEESQDEVQRFQASIGLVSVYLARSRFDRAEEMAQHLAAAMRTLPLPPFTFAAHLFLGMTQYHGGTLAGARTHLDQALEIGELPQPGGYMNFWVLALTYAAFTLGHQGYPDQARDRAQQAMARAATESPYVQGSAAAWAVIFHLTVHDERGVAVTAEIAQRIGDQNGLIMAAALGGFGNGWLKAWRGETAAGIAEMQAGLDALRASGQVSSSSAMMVTLAETYGQAGELDEALRRIVATHAFIQSNGEMRFAAEAFRVEAELHRAREDWAEAQRALDRAIEISRAQGARWWALRAAVSQARLLQQQGQRAAARRALAPAVHGITEGNDSFDVATARKLLAELA